MRTITAGELDQQVTIQRARVTRDEYGAEILSWADVTTVWAKIVERGGREPQLADRPVMMVSYEAIVRNGVTVTHQDRLAWNGMTLSIETVTPLPRGFKTLRCLQTAV